MTTTFVTRALMITGLLVAGATTSMFAQATASARRVAVDKINQQPVAASSVALDSKTSTSLNLTSAQRTQISDLDRQVGSLQAERTKLWSEYRAITSRSNFDDNMAAAEAAPRMLRIVQINNQLAPLAAKQESQLSTILSSSQRTQLSKMVASVKSGM